MAKKFVRGITDVKTINNQDFDTNNVNDLLSDGQYNYIHRKKGKSEEYHNLTDNIKTLFSDNTELLAVTNNNKTTNTATLHPKHDAQKEQVLESQNNTITINHGTNGTPEKTKVDTNPQKVLEHENLLTDYGISKTTSGNTTKLGLEYTKADGLDLNDLVNGCIRGANLLNAPSSEFYYVSSFTEYNYCLQEATKLTDYNSTTYRRLKADGVWGAWREQVGDKSIIDGLLEQKEQVIESTRNTVTIHHGTNGTAEKTTVDTNPQKVLEHENLKTGDGLTTSFNTDETTIMFKATKKPPETNLNTLGEGVIWGNGFSKDQVPSGIQDKSAACVTISISENRKVQFYIRESRLANDKLSLYYRFILNGEVTEWQKMAGDIDNYSEDLNNLTYTCTAKPIDNAPNLPTGVADNGVLSVIRVGNVVSQTYHSLDNNVYYRITNISSSAFVWTPWVKLTTLAV